MGRPLNKKYFGNRNVGTDGTYSAGDAGLGGQGVASIGSITAGSFTGAQADAATLTFPTPSLSGEGAVTAVGTPNFKVLTATISGTQTRAYPVGTGTLTVGSGASASTYTPTITTAALSSVVYASATTISFSTTTNAMISGTSIVIGGSGAGTMTIGGVALQAGQVYYAGAPTTATSATLYATYAASQAATNPLAISNGTTTGFTFTYGTTYGTVTAVTVASGGVIAKGAVTAYAAATTPSTSDGTGQGLQITPATFGLTSATISQAGDGYLSTQTLTVTIGSNQGAAASAVLTVDNTSYAPGTAQNRENAILITANIGGTARANSDIIKQVSGRRYKIENQDGTGIVALVAASPSTAGQATINATDASSGTYYVTKLTAHLAVVTQNSGTTFATGSAVPWTFTSPAPTGYVTIDNG